MLLELGVVADHQVDDSHAAAAGLAAHAPRIKPRAYDRVGAKNLLRGGLHRQFDVVRMGASPPRAANRHPSGDPGCKRYCITKPQILRAARRF